MNFHPIRTVLAIGAIVGFLPVGSAASGDATDSITLVVYDSFPTQDTSLNDALDRFTEDTGIDVAIVVAGDTGTMVSKAVLTAGNPEGDVMFGIDNTYLSRAIDADVFEPYQTTGLDAIAPEFLDLVPNGEATPIDFGDVCVNYDIEWFEAADLDPPTDLASLTDPSYENLLVVENPASSSPGLAFLMASIDEFGPATDGSGGWADYWSELVDNGVAIADGWTEAYYDHFSGAGDGDRPLVVSYGTSPPVEVVYADPPIDAATTGVVAGTCFRQVEFAGVLRGTDSPDEAGQLIDFLISPDFQTEIALNLFVYPANRDVALPQVFTDFAVLPDDPATLAPDVIATNREAWIEAWTDIVLR